MRRVYLLTLVFAMFAQGAEAQTGTDFSVAASEKRIHHDIAVLASDSFAGREAGTEGEARARVYIRQAFMDAGLQPYPGFDDYFQPFRYIRKLRIGKDSYLNAGKDSLMLYKDFFISAYSSSAAVSGQLVNVLSGVILNDGSRNDYSGMDELKGKIFLMCLNLPATLPGNDAGIGVVSVNDRIRQARERGAAAILFYSDSTLLNNNYELFDWVNTESAEIPVLFLSKNAKRSAVSLNGEQISMQVFLEKDNPEAHNVIGRIDNGSERTLYIGAHYDHMGQKEKDGKRMIYHGADDNASGTAAVMEMARILAVKGPKEFNYVFLAFTAEEKGLIGSEKFCSQCLMEKGSFPTQAVNINFDMVGRLGCEGKKIMLMGTGSSSQWKGILRKTDKPPFRVKKIKASIDGSDQVCFKKNRVPYLYFTTGMHKQYHKPADGIALINAAGTAEMVHYTERIIREMAGVKPIVFKKATGFQVFKAYLRFGLMML